MGASGFYVLRVAGIPVMAMTPDKRVEEAIPLPQHVRTGFDSGSSHAWLFQSNPVLYDLRGALCSLQEQVWTASRYAKRIRPGDRVYLWEAGHQGGVAGVAEVIDPARLRSEPAEQVRFARDVEAFAGDRPRVRLRVLKVIEPMIARRTILACPQLATLGVLRCSRGTNFRLSPEEVKALDGLLPSAAAA